MTSEKETSTIRELRRSRGWTLRELGERSGIHHSNLSRLERGIDAVGPKTAMRLSRAFRVGVSRFYDIEREVS